VHILQDELAALNSEIENRHKQELQDVEQREKQEEEGASQVRMRIVLIPIHSHCFHKMGRQNGA
jgi:hypothetical protein